LNENENVSMNKPDRVKAKDRQWRNMNMGRNLGSLIHIHIETILQESTRENDIFAMKAFPKKDSQLISPSLLQHVAVMSGIERQRLQLMNVLLDGSGSRKVRENESVAVMGREQEKRKSQRHTSLSLPVSLVPLGSNASVSQSVAYSHSQSGSNSDTQSVSLSLTPSLFLSSSSAGSRVSRVNMLQKTSDVLEALSTAFHAALLSPTLSLSRGQSMRFDILTHIDLYGPAIASSIVSDVEIEKDSPWDTPTHCYGRRENRRRKNREMEMLPDVEVAGMEIFDQAFANMLQVFVPLSPALSPALSLSLEQKTDGDTETASVIERKTMKECNTIQDFFFLHHRSVQQILSLSPEERAEVRDLYLSWTFSQDLSRVSLNAFMHFALSLLTLFKRKYEMDVACSQQRRRDVKMRPNENQGRIATALEPLNSDSLSVHGSI
jgi:hypothetical protein